MKLLFTPQGCLMFLDAIHHIRDKNPQAANNFMNNCESLLENLKHFPLSGRVVTEFPDLEFRELIVPPYRIFYKIENEKSLIVLPQVEPSIWYRNYWKIIVVRRQYKLMSLA